MTTNTKIEWTDRTWNPVTGCTKVSPGCDNCYAESIARRFAGGPAFPQGFDVTLRHRRLEEPLRWRKPARVFVNSMSDLFHDDVPTKFIADVFLVMAETPQHTYQILTKRHGRMRGLMRDPLFGFVMKQKGGAWPLPNVWLGVSVEDQKWADIRIPALLDTPAAVRFLSCEPLLGPLDLSPWLGGFTCGCPVEPRGRGVSSGDSGRADHRLGGQDLADRGPTRQSLDRRDPSDPMLSASSGAGHGEVPAGCGDVRRGAGVRDGAPAGVAPCERPDSVGADGEPQERPSSGQPALESRAGDPCGADAACPPGAQAGTPGPVRTAQRDGGPDDGSGTADLLQEGGRRAPACPRCGVRRAGADDLQDRARRPTISWVIVGGESGPGARRMEIGWAVDLVDQCRAAHTPVFVKQLGSANGPSKGGDIDTWPEELRVRQYPEPVW